jgi:hypothetical protein
MCGTSAKKKKMGKESTYSELENVLFAWYQQAFLLMGASYRKSPSK